MGYVSPIVMRWVFAAVMTLVVWIAWSSTQTPEALWAPGHLHHAHGKVSSCGQCHEPFRGPTFEKCVQCHTVSRFQQSHKEQVRRFHLSAIDTKESCFMCHTEHQGENAQITFGSLDNPHSEWIYHVTHARTCMACHSFSSGSAAHPKLIENALVRNLFEEGEGAHQRGRFANCSQCHGGGPFDDQEGGHHD